MTTPLETRSSGLDLLPAGGVVHAVLAAMRAVAAAGAAGSPLAELADCAVVVPVGEEAILGSSRLRAGTAQKVVQNAFSTALLVLARGMSPDEARSRPAALEGA